MSAQKKERTPEQIQVAKDRMAAARAAKVSKPKSVPSIHETPDGIVAVVSARTAKDLGLPEHKRSASIPDEFEGLTAKDCCDSCYASGGTCCAITHRDICGHPLKGGLQAPDQKNTATVARYQKVKKILAHAKIEDR